eukprot:7848261-Ditylum_brightwellii.AAC.1
MEILDKIDRKGDFCISKEVTLPWFYPKIFVDGMNGEHLAFPLLEYQANRLRSVAEKAPFGKGMNTVLDESIRKVWQIDGTNVKFDRCNQWQDMMQSIVLNCVASLGMTDDQNMNVHARLYKMLLYEKGGHFKKHRDTEKEP